MGRGSRPVFGISSYEAIAFCNWLSEKEGLIPCYTGRKKATRCDFSANGYRLPTEAEWEYAARGGPLSRGCQYAGSDDPDEVAWYDENSGGELHPVGQKKPNELGLYDMSGNMWDWCWDWYDSDYYNSSPEVDPGGPDKPQEQVHVSDWDRSRRSGSWHENSDALRLAYRSSDGANYRGGGFRLVRTA